LCVICPWRSDAAVKNFRSRREFHLEGIGFAGMGAGAGQNTVNTVHCYVASKR
jgi:hypothetical protein